MKHLLTPLLTLALLASDGAAQRSQETSPVRRARGTFAAADTNKDGVLDAREVSRASIPRDAFAKYDHDGDRNLSSDEFLLYYRQLLLDARRPAGAELDREAARIQALRKAHEQKEARARRAAAEASGTSGGQGTGQEKPGSEASVSTTAKKLERAKDALYERAAAGEMTREQVQALERSLEERARAAAGGAPSAGAGAVVAASGAAPAAAGSQAPVGTREERLRAAHEAAQARERHAARRAAQAGSGSAGASSDPMAGLSPQTRSKVERALAALELRAKAGQMTRAQFEAKKRELLDRARQVDSDPAGAGERGGQTPAERAEAERRRRAAAGGGGQTPAERAEAERRRRAALAGGGQTPAERASAERRRRAQAAAAAERAAVERRRQAAAAAAARRAAAQRAATERRRQAASSGSRSVGGSNGGERRGG
ncbi:MAG: hypothetical protein QF410_11540 [Planctomycetota bacterium]|jgi:hypothetical protein|nr:hypothetical protein [Planctomycetota bacterium]